MLVLFVFGVHLLLLAWVDIRQGRRRSAGSDSGSSSTFPEDAFGGHPSVTVQIPLYNERHVAARIIDACARLDWPAERLQIQVLDDSDDETVAVVAERVAAWQARGVDMAHVRRPSRDGYKAGALQHGLQTATGELIAILDADFLPAADFLRRLVPQLDAPDVGLVQARWGHLNEDESLLTRVQAFGLDAHFTIEQPMRQALGCFINFNGTAGVWRREAIEQAGGWESNTLTEDLDLSYRAQLAGWRLKYDVDTVVPAELPVSMNAFRMQQHRWTKGGVQTAVKLLPRLMRASLSGRVKAEGLLHLTANLVFPFLLLAALVHAPVLLLRDGPGDLYFAVLSVGLLGFLGFFLAHVRSQQAAHRAWLRRMVLFPVFLAGSVGMCVNNSVAAFEVLIGRETPFHRTPKFAAGGRAPRAWWHLPYASMGVPALVWVEGILAAWSVYWVFRLVDAGHWAGVPFQLLFATGFLFVTVYNLLQALRRRHPISP